MYSAAQIDDSFGNGYFVLYLLGLLFGVGEVYRPQLLSRGGQILYLVDDWYFSFSLALAVGKRRQLCYFAGFDLFAFVRICLFPLSFRTVENSVFIAKDSAWIKKINVYGKVLLAQGRHAEHLWLLQGSTWEAWISRVLLKWGLFRKREKQPCFSVILHLIFGESQGWEFCLS